MARPPLSPLAPMLGHVASPVLVYIGWGILGRPKYFLKKWA